LPCSRQLTKPVSAERSSGPDSLQLIISRKCCGRTPSGPPDPGGKERTARITSSSVISTATVGCGSGMEPRSDRGAWCLSTSCAYTPSVFCAGLSSEHTILIAVRMFPSSILAETALASRVAASVDLVLWLTISWSAVHGSMVRFLMTDARLCLLPPLVYRSSAALPTRADCVDCLCSGRTAAGGLSEPGHGLLRGP